MREEISSLKRENHILREERKAKEMDDMLHLKRVKQSYESVNM